MASRRMKIKVMANVGRMGRSGPEPSRSVTPTPESAHILPSPGSPTKPVSSSEFQECRDMVLYSEPSQSMPEPLAICSPVHIQEEIDRSQACRSSPASPLYPMSPEKGGLSLQLAPVSPAPYSPMRSPLKARSCSPIKSPGPVQPLSSSTSLELYVEPKSPVKSPMKSVGRSPGGNTFGNSMAMSKEIGPPNVGNINSTDTLRQRLQKGTSLSTTKYATTRKEFLSKYGHRGEKQPDKKELTILHFTFWNPPKQPGDGNNLEGAASKEENIIRALEDQNSSNNMNMNGRADLNQDESESNKPVGPRVKVGPDGELIIDEQSLVVETSESQRAQKQLAQMETVSGAGYAVGSSGYYSRKRLPKRGFDWTVKETVKFYRALTVCGTDFSMMCQIFPTRTRGELKAKFKREDRRNSALISQALACQTFDPMEEFPVTEDEEDGMGMDVEDFCLPPKKKHRKSLKDRDVSDKAVVKGKEAGHSMNINGPRPLELPPKERCRKIVNLSLPIPAFQGLQPKVPEIVPVSEQCTVKCSNSKKVKLKAEPDMPPRPKGRSKNLLNNQKLSFVPIIKDEPSSSTVDIFELRKTLLLPYTSDPLLAIMTSSNVPGPENPTQVKPAKPSKNHREKKEKKKRKAAEKSDGDADAKVKTKRSKTDSDGRKVKTKDPDRKKKSRKHKNKGASESERPGQPEVSCPEILRFDPSDPLGLKILTPAGPGPGEGNCILISLAEDCSTILSQDGKVLETRGVTISGVENICNTVVDSSPLLSSSSANLVNEVPKSTRRSRNKVMPKYRVPAGGGTYLHHT